jgi:hypothetical protein
MAHKFYWESQYLKEDAKITESFSKDRWKNNNCDEYFKKYGCIRLLE